MNLAVKIPMIETLAQEWRESGVQEGDVLLVHSSVKRVIRRCLKQRIRLTADDLVESFLQAVGESGTLLLPLFNFDWTTEKTFDVRNTPSQMGVLTEAGRTHPEAVRTGHPIYSFAAIGKNADNFKNVDNFSGYGADSPFAILRELDGRIAVLDLDDQESMTYYHHVEESLEVDYRFHKKFSGMYTDASGDTSEKTYGLYVRDVDRGVITYGNPTGELLWEKGIYTGSRPNEGTGLRTALAREVHECIADIISSGNAENMLYRIEKPTEPTDG